ncbi:MAG TPA: hypothetical protein PK509_05825, partial [Catalimonadaceae bacterium]|nr:hypothetical protein [Catalimonadaceae bacterium]
MLPDKTQRPDPVIKQDENLQLREILENYGSYWKWFILSLVFFVSVAFLYLRYTIPQFKATITLMIKDERKGGDVVNEMS